VKRLRKLLNIIGPGFVSGISDDDPSGIATCSQAGAMFGYALGWAALLSFPLMLGVQYSSSAIGAATGKGLAANLKEQYPAWISYALCVLLFAANTINLGADLGAMGAATQLLVPIEPIVFAVVFGVGSVLLISFVHYKNYSRYLKWLCLSLLAYVASAIAVGVDWRSALAGTFIPSFSFNSQSLSLIVAILGTSISPYMVFWESADEVDRLKQEPGPNVLKNRPSSGRREERRLKLDNVVGMAVSQLIALFIIFTCAAALNQHGRTNVQSAAEAASALKPVAGNLTSLIFAAGIVGTGLLAVPILAGAAGYAVGEVIGWKTGLNLQPKQAKGFYGVIAIAVAIGIGLNLLGINVIKFLVVAAIINGIVELPVIAMMMLLARNRKIMGEFTVSGVWLFLGWATLAVMLAAAVGLAATAV
jgi:NRAMP (natural resistance-associated macrophage protein)-like metal ion transporter